MGLLQGSSSQCSSIYAVRFGMEGVMGLKNDEIAVTDLGDPETKDTGRSRDLATGGAIGDLR